MYQGNSKENGGIIGDLTEGTEENNLFMEEASETTSAEESLICQDEQGNEYSLTASLTTTGDITWAQNISKEAVMRRTVAMSQMTSMLRDRDRNAVYEAAIEVCIKSFIQKHSRAPVVLDIGSGTGLLSMLCLKHGAEYVFGVEMFEEMSRIGQEVICANNYEDNILIINAKSTDIDALPMQADIVVSEILDSALLGECCIPSHLDAIRRLLGNSEADLESRVVPSGAEVFGTLLESEEVLHMHDISAIPLGKDTSKPNESRVSLGGEEQYTYTGFDPYRNFYSSDCAGGWPLIPIHYSELLARGARALSASMPVMSVDFFRSAFGAAAAGSDKMSEDNEGEEERNEVTYDTDITVTTEGTVHGVVLWWKVNLLPPSLDPHQQCSYSTAPGAQNWQDHWQQTVFPLAKSIAAKCGDVIRVSVARNNVRMWLNAVLLTSDEIVRPEDVLLGGGGGGAGCFEVHEVEELDENDSYQVVSSRKRVRRDPTEQVLAALSRPRLSANPLAASECGCGWHMLCGADRIQMMNDRRRAGMWDAAIVSMLARLYDQGLLTSHTAASGNSSSGSGADEVEGKTYNVILDMSDGSTFAISTALKMQQHNYQLAAASTNSEYSSFVASSSSLSAKVVSKESKFFSKLFFTQLAGVNDIDDILMVWDGVSVQDIASHFDEEGQNEEDEELVEEEEEGASDRVSMDGNVDASDDANISSEVRRSPSHDYSQAMAAVQTSAASSSSVQVVALMSECYNYQLTALPTWQALSFAYQRTALHLHLHSSAIIMPQKAYVMAAAFESNQLRQCHGRAGIVNGFDHSPLDARQNDWFTHSYPYRLADYQKRLLCRPFVVASLDYKHLLSGQPQSFAHTLIDASGRCDLVAIWVDYQLTDDENSVLRHWDGVNFPPHMKVTLKFLPNSVVVKEGSSQLQSCCGEFTVGDSDFDFEFNVVP